MGQPFLLGRCLRERFGLRDASRISLLLSQLLERTCGLLPLLLRLQFGRSGGFCFFLSEFLGRRRLLGGLQRRRLACCSLLGQACVEINQ